MNDTSIIKVLIVEDSPSAAQLLTHIIHSDPSLKVIGHANNGNEALEFLEHTTPDVITMDIVMPGMDGFETTRRILQTKPVPIVIISSSYRKEDVEKSFRAIEAGALAILEKPRGPFDANYPLMVKAITDTLRMAAGLKLVTRRIPVKSPPSQATIVPSDMLNKQFRAIAIGSSLGGPQALKVILSELPAHFPLPILIVQHISPGFTKGFIEWLSGSSALPIKLAEQGEMIKVGHIYVAPEHFHMEVSTRNMIHLTNGSSVEGIKPSVSKLFSSMAQVYGSQGIGVILTGMGKDGVEDLLLMKKKGAMTIAQDQDGCLMFGMPKEAIAIGAACRIISLQHIAHALKVLAGIEKPA